MKIKEFFQNIPKIRCEACETNMSACSIRRNKITCKCGKMWGFAIKECSYYSISIEIENMTLMYDSIFEFIIMENYEILYKSKHIPDFDLTKDLQYQIETFLLLQ